MKGGLICKLSPVFKDQIKTVMGRPKNMETNCHIIVQRHQVKDILGFQRLHRNLIGHSWRINQKIMEMNFTYTPCQLKEKKNSARTKQLSKFKFLHLN